MNFSVKQVDYQHMTIRPKPHPPSHANTDECTNRLQKRSWRKKNLL